MPTRTLYAGQSVTIKTVGTPKTGYLPVQSASCEVTRPVEFISAFGHIDNIAAVQNNFTTCKATIKAYLQVNPTTSGNLGYTSTATGSEFDASFIKALTGDAVNGANTVITVQPNGFVMSGILTNIGMDVAMGAFGTVDLSFAGVGEPWFATGAQSFAGDASNPTMPVKISPVTSTYVSGSVTGAGCANSFKFSLDIPNETLACLGDTLTGSQAQLSGSVMMIAKLPMKSTVTVEGYGVDISTNTGSKENADNTTLSALVTGAYIIGDLKVTLPSPRITSKSFNNAVGAVGATYNYTVEDTSVNFADA
jgi:hypothetical protein